MAIYLDTSALAKLVVEEAESAALWAAITGGPDLVSCDLARTELVRAVRRVLPELALRARDVLDTCTLVAVTARLFEAAGRLDPPLLRSLDAIHIAVALDLGDDVDALVTYDQRMADAAAANGLPVLSPS